MEDKLLVLRCKRGSPDALGRIYEKYKNDLLILAIALLNETSAAEDIVHDVFLSFVQAIEKFRLTGSLRGYLLTCVANRARNANKAKHGHRFESDPPEPVCPDLDEPSQSIMCNEQLQQLSNAMAQLPYEQREVLMLHFQAAMTLRKVANSLGISVNTAKSRCRYGLHKLRSILDHEAKE
ncbi:MAG: sigma-70 family RNA polymerase sigma factor [Phycisphaerales bacterium]|jgi:RNA polymerase sigma-70 factor (ECF subfamily)